jgi:hypothetical protein
VSVEVNRRVCASISGSGSSVRSCTASAEAAVGHSATSWSNAEVAVGGCKGRRAVGPAIKAVVTAKKRHQYKHNSQNGKGRLWGGGVGKAQGGAGVSCGPAVVF